MSSVITFVMANEVVLAALGVAILDLAFALNSNLAGNGILHQIYLTLKGLVAPAAKS